MTPTPGSSPPALPDAPPQTIGKFQVLERLGAGAVGVVYKCSQPDLDRPVAVKVLLSARHATADQLARFQREARAAARLNHPNVVQVFDVGCENGLHYIVMEYIDGWPFDRLIGKPTLTVPRALRIIYHVARALQTAHEQGVVHRDVKPSNILVQRSGLPKLSDFGLAKLTADGRALSSSGDLIGTPRYMSPEQVLSDPADVDARTDVYSLGAVMYEALCGVPPVDGPNAFAVLRQLTEESPVPLRQRNPAIPEPLAAVCHCAGPQPNGSLSQRGAFRRRPPGVPPRTGPRRLANRPRHGGLAGAPSAPALVGRRRPGLARRRPSGRRPARALPEGAARGGAPTPPATRPNLSGLVDRAREQLDGPTAGPDAVAAGDRLRTAIDDLTAVLTYDPDDDAARFLRAAPPAAAASFRPPSTI